MLFNRQKLPELFIIKHRHDDSNNHVNYEDKILDSSLSPYIFNNVIMSEWLSRIRPLLSLFFDKVNITKNFKNYIVDKYEYRHSN